MFHHLRETAEVICKCVFTHTQHAIISSDVAVGHLCPISPLPVQLWSHVSLVCRQVSIANETGSSVFPDLSWDVICQETLVLPVSREKKGGTVSAVMI